MSHTAYYYTVTNFGNFIVLDEPPVFSFNLEILIVPILAFIVQTFFAHRAWAIDNKQWPLSVGIETFAVCQLVFGISQLQFFYPCIKTNHLPIFLSFKSPASLLSPSLMAF
jgi:hypothetical protein